jgi:GT2 family glycosyltransferase
MQAAAAERVRAPDSVSVRFQISIIIPAYNAVGTLGEQLEALLAQAYAGEWEIIVVDNRSSDGTAALVQCYQARWPSLRLVPACERQGRAYACNVGARAATGQALIFADADDVAAPGWLATLGAALAEHDFVASCLDAEALNQALPWHPQPPNWATTRNLDFLPFAGGALMAVARGAFEAVGGFDERAPYCEDIDLSWRLQLHGYRLYCAEQAVMHVRYRGSEPALWKQQVRFAAAHAYLYKHFHAQGMPRSSARAAGRELLRLARTAGCLRGPDRKARLLWLRAAGVRWGRLVGSLRYGVLYL